ncbi:Vascular endothelial growth factor receptor 3 [Collichthys lucidus]|uniref:Vascular endothelial growth factor receptor 3 n=1 Tax=Collichthys lucidus TaxID=240159 RepID=A0A4U5U351_COLLU|nr:Vascular endothelial growth factor receptor 3 [Collichthys lucidus]
MLIDGMLIDGMLIDGMLIDGMLIDGMLIDGMLIDGMLIDGMLIDGMLIDDKPRLQGSPHSEITIKAGSPLLLNCSAWGNPSLSYSWTLPSGSPHSSSSNVLSIDSVASADGGLYTCSVSNSRGTINVEFDVTVEETNIILIIVIVVIVAVLVCLFVLVCWRYYRTKRMGKYTLKDVFRLGKQHTAVPITE